MDSSSNDQSLRRAVRLVALLNLAYFGVEFAVALAIGSVSLFADSIDFLEDTSINFLILVAGRAARGRTRRTALWRGHRLGATPRGVAIGARSVAASQGGH